MQKQNVDMGGKRKNYMGGNPHVLRILKFSLDEGRQFYIIDTDASICLSLYVQQKVLEFRVEEEAGFMKMTFQPKNTQRKEFSGVGARMEQQAEEKF